MEPVVFEFDLILAPFSAFRTNEFVKEMLLTMLSVFRQSHSHVHSNHFPYSCLIDPREGVVWRIEREEKKNNSLDFPPTDPIESP